MTFAALTNWKYDKNLYHNIQSGPQRTGDTLNLTDTYKLVSSGYRMPDGFQQSFYTVIDQGPDFGIITPGPPMTYASEIGQPTYPENKTIIVTVVQTPQGNRYFFDGQENINFFIYKGSTYRFDVSHQSNLGHEFLLSLTEDGFWNGGATLTDNVVYFGVDGRPGAYCEISGDLKESQVVYPFCGIHINMGGTTNFPNGGTPRNNPIYLTDKWRYVPPAVPGYWSDYNPFEFPAVSGQLTLQDGFRYQNIYHSRTASTVQTALGRGQPGLRNKGAYTWWGAFAPNNQSYSPFQTPQADGQQNGSTGGGVSYPRAQYPTLTNPTSDTSGSRASWKYNPPVYCETFSELVRPKLPGALDSNIRRMYRGKSSMYVTNYGGVYGVIGEAARNIQRTYSASVNGAGVITK